MADRPKSTHTKRRIIEKQPGMPIATILLVEKQEKPHSASNVNATDIPRSNTTTVKGSSSSNGTHSPRHSNPAGNNSTTPSLARDGANMISTSPPKTRKVTVNLDARAIGTDGSGWLSLSVWLEFFLIDNDFHQ